MRVAPRGPPNRRQRRPPSLRKTRAQQNDLPDCRVAQCVRDEMRRIHFPAPEGGIVTVIYPIMFQPG